jgi:hypothetical protein
MNDSSFAHEIIRKRHHLALRTITRWSINVTLIKKLDAATENFPANAAVQVAYP